MTVSKSRRLALLFATLLTAGGTPSAEAASCRDVDLPDTYKAGSNELVLNGLGVRKATMFKVNVYVAGLYIPQKSSDGEAIASANQPWHLELHFLRDVEASDIRDAFDEGFEDTAGDKLDSLKPRIETLNGQIVDLKEGQVLAYSYDPASGTVMNVNGTAGDPIEGVDFAQVLLAISIGSNPPNQELKTGLLGGTCE